MRTGGYCGDFFGEVRLAEPELLEAGPGGAGGPTVLTFKGGRFELGYPLGMPVGVDRSVSFQVYVDGELVEATGKPVAVLPPGEGKQQRIEVIGIATRLRQMKQENVLNHAGGRRVRLRWEGSGSADVAEYRIYGNGGAGAVDYAEVVGEVKAARGGVRLAELEWRTGELADGGWRFGIRTADAAGNVAESPARETDEIEVCGLPRPVAEVTFAYEATSATVELNWTGSASFN